MAFIRAFMNGIVLLFNLIVTGSIIAFTAYAAGTTIMMNEPNKGEVYIPEPIEIDISISIGSGIYTSPLFGSFIMIVVPAA